jgi:hypothetical protein
MWEKTRCVVTAIPVSVKTKRCYFRIVERLLLGQKERQRLIFYSDRPSFSRKEGTLLILTPLKVLLCARAKVRDGLGDS